MSFYCGYNGSVHATAIVFSFNEDQFCSFSDLCETAEAFVLPVTHLLAGIIFTVLNDIGKTLLVLDIAYVVVVNILRVNVYVSLCTGQSCF